MTLFKNKTKKYFLISVIVSISSIVLFQNFSLPSPQLSNYFPTWFNSELGPNEYITTLAETRSSHYDPQAAPDVDKLNSNWRSVTSGVTQIFKTTVDQSKNQAYFRKDILGQSFWGELFNWDDQYFYLTTESTPNFPGIDPKDVWIEKEDHFRLFINELEGPRKGRYAQGSIFAPLRFWNGFSYSHNFKTYACLNYKQYVTGECPIYQSHFNDQVTIQVITGSFDILFDGELSQYNKEVDPAFRNLDAVVIVNQNHMNGVGRERYFFGHQGGRYLGLVRWDNSAPSSNGWVVIDRTVGFKIGTSLSFSIAGLKNRGAMAYPSVNTAWKVAYTGRNQDPRASICPAGMFFAGSFLATSTVWDITGIGFNLTENSPKWVNICNLSKNPTNLQVLLVKGGQCSKSQYQGGLHVKTSFTYSSLTLPRLNKTGEGWVELCAIDEKNLTSPTVFAETGCPNGTHQTGSMLVVNDAYDVFSTHRSRKPNDWLIQCSK